MEIEKVYKAGGKKKGKYTHIRTLYSINEKIYKKYKEEIYITLSKVSVIEVP